MKKIKYEAMYQPTSITYAARLFNISEVSIWILIVNDEIPVSHLCGQTRISLRTLGDWLAENTDVHERLMKPVGISKNALLEIYA